FNKNRNFYEILPEKFKKNLNIIIDMIQYGKSSLWDKIPFELLSVHEIGAIIRFEQEIYFRIGIDKIVNNKKIISENLTDLFDASIKNGELNINNVINEKRKKDYNFILGLYERLPSYYRSAYIFNFPQMLSYDKFIFNIEKKVDLTKNMNFFK